MAKLYGDHSLIEKAKSIHQLVSEQSFDGTFFVDNAVRYDSGVLQPSGESTEVCQYYAFFCCTATLNTHADLWRIMLNHFGPDQTSEGTHYTLHPANAFIGYYMRMELLSRFNRLPELIAELKGYFLNMVRLTGTRWEHSDVRASCNHGFASHLCVHLCRDALGVQLIDYEKQVVTLNIPEDLKMTQCSGSIPVGNQTIDIKWWRTETQIEHTVSTPDGWEVSYSK